MKAFLLACCAIVLISVAANIMLREIGFSSAAQTSSPAVRLDQ